MSLSPTGNSSAPGTAPGGRAAADPGRAVQARPTVALVVDDEPKIRDLARRYLEADGFQVLEAADGEAALTVLAVTEADIVVTDIMMPVLNGLELLRQIRLTSSVPVVMLTARDDEIDKVLALTTGADDYVTKPFGGRELAARLRAILRRLQPPHAASAPSAGGGEAAEAALTFAGITMDPGRRSVHTSGGRVTVTALDYDLLLALARNPGLVLSRRQLLAAVWDDDAYVDERVVDVHIRTLRRALGDDAAHPSIIETVRSIGYRFLPPPA
jgi:two-component system alkaline phosphatase synthesis response regulator PhoP